MNINYKTITEEELLKIKDNLDGYDWCWLLNVQPQLSIHCNWNKLDGGDWAYLLSKHPQFMKHCVLRKFSTETQKYILNFYKEAL